MSDSVQPHRRQPTRLPRPWDSPDKNTGVGCHFLLQCMKVKSESEIAQLCLTLSDPMACSLPGSSVHGILQARVLEWAAIAFSSLVLHLHSNPSPATDHCSSLGNLTLPGESVSRRAPSHPAQDDWTISRLPKCKWAAGRSRRRLGAQLHLQTGT